MAISATSRQALPKPTSSTKAHMSSSASSTRISKRMVRSAGWTSGGRLNHAREHAGAVPHPRRACALFDLDRAKVRVFCERVGGGFGGKQEMLVEDIVALAALKTGRPVKLEFTREEQFTATTTRHPMRVAGEGRRAARRHADGHCDARHLQHRRLWQPRRAACLFHACGECDRVYRCANKKVDGCCRLYQHPAGRRVPRLWPAADQLRGRIRHGRTGARLGMDAIEFRRLNVVRPGDPMLSTARRTPTMWIRQLRARSMSRSGRGQRCARRRQRRPRREWLVGEGMAMGMINTVPPRGHVSEARIALRADGDYELSSAPPNSATARPPSTRRSRPRCSATPPERSGSRALRHRSWRPRYRRLRQHRHRRRRDAPRSWPAGALRERCWTFAAEHAGGARRPAG